MTTTHLLTTALPASRGARDRVHLTAFVTHKLVPDAADATLADFPAALDWVSTLQAGRFELLASHLAGPVPLTVVPDADAAAWRAVFPPHVPVEGYPAPTVSTAPWRSFPAHRTGDGAVDLHLLQLTAAPTSTPGVVGSPVLSGVVQVLAEVSVAVRELLTMAERRSRRAEDLLARRTQEAQASLGLVREAHGYPTRDQTTASAIEVLLADAEADTAITQYLDSLVGQDLSGAPELQLLVDAHTARRFYQRPEAEYAYRDRPVEGAAAPRPERPNPDFHARAASFGSTPVMLRRLGLAVDLRVEDADVRTGLDAATWLAVRFVPGPDADVTVLAHPRTQVVVRGDVVTARSSDAWVAGALPLGDETYVVLDVDPDASGLKTEQHLRDLPRTLAAEVNGDPATSAPATLRSTGFAIARTDRVETTRTQVARAEAMTSPVEGAGAVGPDLLYDDLVRGLRVEVWDDVTRTWHSLHERRVTATADPGTGAITVLDDEPDVGFLQLSGLHRVPGPDSNPYYLHEVIAGWDGWSLSAPRPGRVVVRDGATETVVDAPTDPPATGVALRTRVEPGSLPRLRHGTSYAFRVVGVDLAGGSVRRTGPRRPVAMPAGGDAPAAAREHLERLRGVYRERDTRLLGAARDRVLDALPVAEPGPDWRTTLTWLSAHEPPQAGSGAVAGSPAERVAAVVPEAVRTGDLAIDAVIADRISTGAAGASMTSDAAMALRAAAAGTHHLAAGAGTWRVRPQLEVDPGTFAALWALDDLVVGPGALPPSRAVVTTPRPFLRWDPVPPPSLVARAPLTTGEQLSRIVVRSGLDTGSPDAVATSERHVVPAKATQTDAELAGRFDEAIGSPDPDVQRVAYGWALRESGTLLDRWIPDPANPGGVVEQPGIALHQRPGANPDTLVTLADITDHRDTPLGEGQYVVHDVDELVVPYLPDPYAAGVALVFYDAGAPHLLPEPRVLQAVTVPFAGSWPRGRPLRLVVEAAGADEELGAVVEELGAGGGGTVVRVRLPAGLQVRVAMSSSMRREDLDRFGLWRSHLASTVDPDGDGGATPEDVVAAAALVRAAVNGWTWWLTPSVDLRLVHAVPAPVRPPAIEALRCLLRPPGLTVAQLAGLVDVHGPSTDRLVVRASWTEQVDDLAAPGPTTVARDDVVVSSPVSAGQRTGLLTMVDFQPFGPSADMLALAGGGVGLHRAIQTFPDTHHRRVTYTPSGLTRYAEMFAAQDVPEPQDPLLAGEPVTLEIPSSARPAAPDLVDAVPLLRWEETTEPDQPFALRRVRRSGVRLWLRRPWFSSGDGELLGVVVSRTGHEPDATISLWGRDPTVLGAATGPATLPPLLRAGHLLVQMVGGTTLDEPARPVLPVAAVPLVDLAGAPVASVLAYRPEYHPERGLWHVDIALDDGPALWPFVRLAVGRYQPDSIEGCALSAVGLTSWVQPLPTRTATVNRPDEDHVRVTVTGAVAFLRTPRRGEDGPRSAGDDLDADTPTGAAAAFDALLAQSRTMHASVQVLPDGAGDLGWVTVAERRLPAVGVGDESSFRVTWSGGLDLPAPHARPAPLELRTPGDQPRWRVLIEERELLDADPVDRPNASGATSITPRVVYADAVVL
ncbi:hypothetical protein [Actinotalea sp. K2]|uniref:hypothetical protein n=1 Tax=Actinotalea sp. K2 TaxID=2939438 RepID=UPI002017CF65|nr:hypothetical protein [Actinotalea sp. K2]MCL3862338.1 hypothetical protein [Actinotalea sp. K2]